MNKLTASYLAGLIDGEGSLEIQKRKKPECVKGYYYTARMRVGMTNKEIIEWLKNSFGGSISEREGKGNNKDSWTWSLNYGKVKPFLMKILPYLKVKKEQGEILRKFLNTFKSNSYKIVKNETPLANGGTGKHKELKEEVWDYREKLYQQIRRLNSKGSCTLRD